jgi:hypothetical protein
VRHFLGDKTIKELADLALRFVGRELYETFFKVTTINNGIQRTSLASQRLLNCEANWGMAARHEREPRRAVTGGHIVDSFTLFGSSAYKTQLDYRKR